MIHDPFLVAALALSGLLLGTLSVACWTTRDSRAWRRVELRILRAFRPAASSPIRHARAR